jgi:hypothetical protein
LTLPQPRLANRLTLKKWTGLNLNNTLNPVVEHVVIERAWNGISYKGTWNAGTATWDGITGRGYFANVGINAYNIAVEIDGMTDSSRFIGVHLWPYGGDFSPLWYDPLAIGYQIGRADDLSITNGLGITGTHFNFVAGADGAASFTKITGYGFDGYQGILMPNSGFVGSAMHSVLVSNSTASYGGVTAASRFIKLNRGALHWMGGYIAAVAFTGPVVEVDYSAVGVSGVLTFEGVDLLSMGITGVKWFQQVNNAGTDALTISIQNCSIWNYPSVTDATPTISIEQSDSGAILNFTGNHFSYLNPTFTRVALAITTDANHRIENNNFFVNSPVAPGWTVSYPVPRVLGHYQHPYDTDLVVSVKSYGACGNGVCDDTAAIQAAVTAATAGQCVRVLAGSYKVSSQITIPNQDFCIVGDGKASTQFLPTAAFPDSTPLFAVTGTAAAQSRTRLFRGFTIDFIQPDISKQIITAVVATNVGTITTSTSHGYSIGDIAIFFNWAGGGGEPLAFNGRYTVASTPSGTQFTVATIGIGDDTYTPALAYVQSKRSLKKWIGISAVSNYVNGLEVDDVAIKGAYNGIAFKGTYAGYWTRTVSEGKFSKIDMSVYNRGFDIDGMLGSSVISDSGCSAAYQSARGGTAGGYSLLEADITTICYKVGRADDLKIRGGGAGIVGTGLSVTTSEGGDPRTARVTVSDAIFDGETGIYIAPTTTDFVTPHVRVENSYFYLIGEGAATYTNRPLHHSIYFGGGFLQVVNSYFFPSTADATAITPIYVKYTIAGKQNSASFVGSRFVEYSGVVCDKPFLTQANSSTYGTLTLVGNSITRNGVGAYTTPAFDFQQTSGSSVQVVFTGNIAGRYAGSGLLYKFIKDDAHVAFGNSFSASGWTTEFVAGVGKYQQWTGTITTPKFLTSVGLRNADYDEGTVGSSLEFGFVGTSGITPPTIQSFRSSANAAYDFWLNKLGGTVFFGGPPQLFDPGAKPTCDATTRGTIWKADGGAGVADTTEVCAKNSSNTYAWYAMATIP